MQNRVPFTPQSSAELAEAREKGEGSSVFNFILKQPARVLIPSASPLALSC